MVRKMNRLSLGAGDQLQRGMWGFSGIRNVLQLGVVITGVYNHEDLLNCTHNICVFYYTEFLPQKKNIMLLE